MPTLHLLIRQLRGIVPALLAITAAVSLAAGDVIESAAIAAVLVLDVAIGFLTEWRAQRALEALTSLQTQAALVRRGGEEREIDAARLVRGDVLVLAAGAAIAADARLLAASELRIVEAPLTGEPFPVDKDPLPVPAAVLLAERSSLVFKGTVVAAGSGLALVTATGTRTEIGRVGELVATTRPGPTPLERRLERLGKDLVLATLLVAAVVAALGVVRGLALAPMVETALALAIAAVPESLPAVATVVLAMGLHRMARRHALVKQLPAVETLGSTTVLCTDKTGTLTAGEMTATRVVAGERVVEIEGAGYAVEGGFRLDGAALVPGSLPALIDALAAAALVNRARLGADDGSSGGDPTDLALLVAAAKAGLRRADLLRELPEIGELPFRSDRMLMATFHRHGDGIRACVKGAPGALLARCATVLVGRDRRLLDETGRAALRDRNAELAAAGLRVLAIASRELAPGEAPGEAALRDLTWLGMVGIEDLPVAGVQGTIASLRAAGIRVVMLTGDQLLTAAAVARRLGILAAGEEVLDGRELARLDDGELRRRLQRTAVISRLQPADKLRVVEALQAGGDVVAMLGDGINDGPALRRADIGVALGRRGTDVAKETAAMVLADDRLESVAAAVAEGRVIRDNVGKVLFYLFSCNLAEVAVVASGVAAGLPVPLTPLQILWLNLVTDVGPALGLAMEPAEADLMERPPRAPGEELLSRRLLVRIGGWSALLAGATLASFGWMLLRGATPAASRTVAFASLALGQLVHAWNARGRSVRRRARGARNPWLWLAVAASVALQLAVVYLPSVARAFGTVRPDAPAMLAILAAAAQPLALGALARRRAAGRAARRARR